METTKPGCRRIHSESIPLKIEDDVLTILVDKHHRVENNKFSSFNKKQLNKNIREICNEEIECQFSYFETQYKVKEKYLKNSVEFALNVLNNMTPRDFQNQQMQREEYDQIIDIIEGKLSEYLFKDFFSSVTDLIFTVDNEIYESTTETDGGNDLLFISGEKTFINNFRVDIKSSKHYSQWLLVEETKIMADVYILVKMKFENEKTLSDMQINKSLLKNKDYRRKIKENIMEKLSGNYNGEIAGFAYLSDLIDPLTKQPWLKFPEGRNLINPKELKNIIAESPQEIAQNIDIKGANLKKMNTELKAKSNYGIPVKLLRKNKKSWISLFKKIESACLPINNQIYKEYFKSHNN